MVPRSTSTPGILGVSETHCSKGKIADMHVRADSMIALPSEVHEAVSTLNRSSEQFPLTF